MIQMASFVDETSATAALGKTGCLPAIIGQDVKRWPHQRDLLEYERGSGGIGMDVVYTGTPTQTVLRSESGIAAF
jgi:hypothetical protein